MKVLTVNFPVFNRDVLEVRYWKVRVVIEGTGKAEKALAWTLDRELMKLAEKHRRICKSLGGS